MWAKGLFLFLIQLRIGFANDVNCNFDIDACNWTQDRRDDFNWTRHSCKTSSVDTGPRSDHSTGYGYYMYIETSSPRRNGDKARLISPGINGAEQMCLVFFYHMNGTNINALNVYLSRTGFLNSPVWSKRTSQSTSWNKGRAEIAGGPATRGITNIVFEGVRGIGFRGDIAIDDVSLTPGPCGDGSDCSFDTSICSWKNDYWKRHSYKTPSAGTGPSYDHTSGHGYYMYIETSDQLTQGQRARLVSTPINGTNRMCLVFYYHMYGPDINRLNVYFSRRGSLSSPVWSKFRAQGNLWERATVQITGGSATRTVTIIVIEGLRGAGGLGDIAIDDVSIKPGTCDEGHRCDFEFGKCGWSNSRMDNFSWVIRSGTTNVNSYTRPATDHTKGYSQGKYLFIDGTRQRPGDVAILQSSTFRARDSQCMTFYYYMFGKASSTLNVLVKAQNQNASLLWSVTGEQGVTWMKGVVAIPQETSILQVLIEGVTNSSNTGNIAIDDINFNNQSPCVLTPQKASVKAAVPEVLTGPYSDTINVLAGNDLTVHCTDKDAKPAIKSFSWSHNNQMSTSEMFHIQNVTKSDEGRLTCAVHNRVGTRPGRKDIFIRVVEQLQALTVVHLEPNSDIIRIDEGQSLFVNCVVNDEDPVLTSIIWTHNGRNSSGSAFHIQIVTQSDEGRLTCTAHNGVGTSPGRADTFILVVVNEKVTKAGRQVSDGGRSDAPDTSNWSLIHSVAIITGTVAALVIAVLVAVVIHLCRKVGATSGSKAGTREAKKTAGASNPVYNQEDAGPIYENTRTNNDVTYETADVIQRRGSVHGYESIKFGDNQPDNLQDGASSRGNSINETM